GRRSFTTACTDASSAHRGSTSSNPKGTGFKNMEVNAMTKEGTINQQPYVRMVIGEAETDEALSEFLKTWNDEQTSIAREGGFIGGRLLTEDGGRMIVIETVFATRDDCLRHHCSRAYRQFVAKTQHLLVGSFVVKLFKQAAYHQ